MTKVLMSTSLAGPRRSHAAGEVAEFDDATAARLVAAGYAAELPPDPPAGEVGGAATRRTATSKRRRQTR